MAGFETEKNCVVRNLYGLDVVTGHPLPTYPTMLPRLRTCRFRMTCSTLL